MRLLNIVPTYLPATRYGGPIYAVHGLCRSLANLGHEVHVFTTNANGVGESEVPLGKAVSMDGLQVHYFRSNIFRRLYFSSEMQKALIKQLPHFDLVHLHSIFLWPTLAGARCAKKAKIPYLVAPLGMLDPYLIERKNRWIKTAWIYLVEKKNLEEAAGIHFTSPLEERKAKSFPFHWPPSFVVPNGIEPYPIQENRSSISSEIKKIFEKKPYLLCLGRINWNKGLDRLVSALPSIPKVPLVIAGNDEERYRPFLERLASEKKVRERVFFLGPVYGSDKMDLLKNAVLFVLASHGENFGNVVLEAMSVGCPVVVTPEVGLAETVSRSGAGIVVKGDPEVLGPSIRDLIGREDLLKQMGEKGKEIVKKEFTWDIIAQKMEKVYAMILGQ